MNWRHGSSRVSAKASNLSSNSSPTKKKRERENEGLGSVIQHLQNMCEALVRSPRLEKQRTKNHAKCL
jgi:hypothetical protein